MGRLNGHKSYLAGSMDVDRENGRIWRLDFTPFLASLGVEVYNPYEKPLQDTDGLEDDANHLNVVESLKMRDYDEVTRLMKEVRHVDLRMVSKSDFLIVNMDWTKRPCGTIREIIEAARMKLPVIMHCVQPIYEQPPWMFSELDYKLWFETWEEVKEYLIHVDESATVDKMGKWVFFK